MSAGNKFWHQNKAARAIRGSESGGPRSGARENVLLSEGASKNPSRGCMTLLHRDRASMVLYFVEMAQNQRR